MFLLATIQLLMSQPCVAKHFLRFNFDSMSEARVPNNYLVINMDFMILSVGQNASD